MAPSASGPIAVPVRHADRSTTCAATPNSTFSPEIRPACAHTPITTPTASQIMRLTQFIKLPSLVIAAVTVVSLSAVAADEKTAPDNTGINKRDRSGETNTSGDQSNSSADLKITQDIRRALMKDGQLSTTAKNIKIVTAAGQVTLRGPVKTAEEKSKVAQIAKSAAGGAQIVDQLDVERSR
jgi:hyperosmotically inducible periplasmic protein